MATASRTFARALRSTPAASTLNIAATCRLTTGSRQTFQQQARRGYASSVPKLSSNSTYIFGGLLVGLISGAGIYATNHKPTLAESPPTQTRDEQGQKGNTEFSPKTEDYQAVYDAIAQKLIDDDDYDDGSYGPVILRLGWHASGTYDAETKTGGSNGATMRFAPEKDHGANAGLKHARDFLEQIKEQFPWITYSDLWTLAAVRAVQEMGGSNVPWRPGRSDRDVSYCTPDGRLPNGAKGQDHLRAIFYRMGFNDQEIVALSGAHALGRCHADRSGFEGAWTFSPITLTNDFYKLLLDEKWNYRNWSGPRQFQDDSTKTLMMLPSDMALVVDGSFKQYVEKYAADQNVFFDDFSKVITKLFELGVPFRSGEDARIEFKRME